MSKNKKNKEQLHWLTRPETIKKLWKGGLFILFFLLILDLIIPAHPYFEIDGTIGGMIKLAPAAIFTAIYRPLPNEIGSPMMVVSVIENLFLILLSVFIVIRLNPIRLIKIILKEPFLVFALTFSIIFAFGVGIASTNFGALVRYKIPLMPFFFTSLFIIRSISKNRLNDTQKI